MRVYDVGGVSDAELIKPKPKTRAPVAPPLSAAEQRQVAQRLTAAHAGNGAVARVRAQSLRTPAPVQLATSINAAPAARRGPGPACMKFWRRSAPGRRRGGPRAWPADGRDRSASGVFGFGLPPGFTREKHADGRWREVVEGQPPPQLTLQLRRLRAGSARWMRAVGQGGRAA